MSTQEPKITDAFVHLGRGPSNEGRQVNLPIVQGSTVLFNTLSAFEAARDSRYEPGTLYYGRYGNEATFELEAMIAQLEGAEGAIAVSAGLSAVTLALMSATEAGKHVLVADNVYTPTRTFCDGVLARFGVDIQYFDPMIGDSISRLMRPETAVVMFEAPGSGTFEVPDIPAIAAAARTCGAISILDGTWATPVFCKPLALGVDVVAHSASKYICGHSDAMLGLIVCNAGTYLRMRKGCLAFGERASGQDIFLALRGLRTLEMRMRHAEEAGMRVASWLGKQPQVLRLLHPATPDCPGHAHWKRDFAGTAGLFSVVVKPCGHDKVHAFIDALKMFGVGVSWGGFESLVLPVEPLRTVSPWREEGRVIRFNIGHESTDSLIADLTQALPLLD